MYIKRRGRRQEVEKLGERGEGAGTRMMRDEISLRGRRRWWRLRGRSW